MYPGIQEDVINNNHEIVESFPVIPKLTMRNVESKKGQFLINKFNIY